MSELWVGADEREVLKAVDLDMLAKLIERSLEERQVGSLQTLHLEKGGPYVASRLRAFAKALAEYDMAKAPRKREATERSARRAGDDLESAVAQMKNRVAQEEREDQFFAIDDLIAPPARFDAQLCVRVSYRWRSKEDDEWQYGAITFVYHVERQVDVAAREPKRKPNASQQERQRQESLYREWEHLKRLGLESLREFFRSGGAASAVPTTFQVAVAPHTRELNNFSARFSGSIFADV